MNKLIENIKLLMRRKKWNNYDLERASGVPQPTIHRILSGNHMDPRTRTVQKIARGLGVTEAQLRGFDDKSDAAGTEEPDNSPREYLETILTACDRAMRDSRRVFTDEEKLDIYLEGIRFSGEKRLTDELVMRYLQETLKK